MTQRRPLIDGLKDTPPPIDHAKEKDFVFNGKPAKPPEPPAAPVVTATAPTMSQLGRVPISTRMRGDYATALKRASLERQLGGIEPNTLIEILEQAVEPWLRTNGYLK
jgi:hypothetical protein